MSKPYTYYRDFSDPGLAMWRWDGEVLEFYNVEEGWTGSFFLDPTDLNDSFLGTPQEAKVVDERGNLL